MNPQTLFEFINGDGAHSNVDELIAIMESTKPTFIKAMRQVSKYGKGYKLPIYGKMKASKQYEEMLASLKSGTTEVKTNVPTLWQSQYPELSEEWLPYPATGRHISKEMTGTDKSKILVGGAPGDKGYYETLVHEMLHEMGTHGFIEPVGVGYPSRARDLSVKQFLSKLVAPRSRYNYGLQSRRILNEAMNKGLLKLTEDPYGVYGRPIANEY